MMWIVSGRKKGKGYIMSVSAETKEDAKEAFYKEMKRNDEYAMVVNVEVESVEEFKARKGMK